jgi:hypothetical protein
MTPRSEWSRAVVRVGDGRGTVVETTEGTRYVVTAAHCLPSLPVAHAASYTAERTYAKLLGELGAEPTVWAELLFADPVADLAVLSAPDNQELGDEAEAYEALMEGAIPLPIGRLSFGRGTATLHDGSTIQRPPHAESAAWMLFLDGQWGVCRAEGSGRALWIEEGEAVQGGMSGSPVVADGAVIGIISTGGGPNPYLADTLPAWILREAGARRATAPT